MTPASRWNYRHRSDDHLSMSRRLAAAATLSLLGLLVLASPAWAHVEVEPEAAVAASVTTLTFTAEYEGAATTGLVVQLPDGAVVTDVPEKAGWTSTVDDAAHTVSWTGGSAPDDETFSVVVQLPPTPGEVLFPAIQQTTDGEEAWIGQEEAEGEAGHPAPRLTLLADPNATTITTAQVTTSTTVRTTTTTTAEADDDDGGTSAAPWLVGGAVVTVVAGALILRRQRG